MFKITNKKTIFAILMINIFLVMVGVGLITPILPQLIIEFGASGQSMGLLVAFYGLSQFLLSPKTGRLSDRYGRKAFLVTGIAVFAAAKLLFAIGDALWMLYASRLLEGVAAALIVPPMMAYAADITTIEERAKANSLLAAAMSLGFVIGPGLGGFLAGYGTRVPLYAASGAAIAALIVASVCLPESLSKEQRKEARLKAVRKESILQSYAKIVEVPICGAFSACFRHDVRDREF